MKKVLLIACHILLIAVNAQAQSREIGPGVVQSGRIGFGDESSQLVQDLSRQVQQAHLFEDRIRSDARSQQSEVERVQRQARSDEDSSRQMQSDVVRLRQQEDSLQAQFRQLENAVSSSQAAIRNAESQIASAHQQVIMAGSQQRQNNQEISLLESQRNPQLLQQNQSEKSSLASAKQALVQRNEDLQKWINDIGPECSNTECLARKISFENALRENNIKISDIDKQLQQIERVLLQLQEVETNLARRVAYANQLAQQVADSQRTLAQAESQVASARSRLVSDEQQLSRSRSDLASIQNNLRSSEQRAVQARRQADSSAITLRQAQDRARQIDDSLRLAQQQTDDLERALADAQAGAGVERLVLVGNRLGSGVRSELSQTRVQLVNIEQSAVALNRDSVVYIFADTLTKALSQKLSDELVKLAKNGAYIVIVGDVNTLAAKGALAQIIGVETASSGISSRLSGVGLLQGLVGPQSTSVKTYSLRSLAGVASTESILIDSRNSVIGITQSVRSSVSSSDGRVMVIGVDLEATQLRILGNIEKTLCVRVGSGEARNRAFCQ